MVEAISVNNVVKRFKSYESVGLAGALFRRKRKIKTAVNGVSFNVKKGEIVALLGRNGSGKSTMIKMLSGILYPDSGSARVLGMDPWKDRIALARRMGVVFGSTHAQLWWNLPPIDTFHYIRDVYAVPKDVFKRRLAAMVKALSIKDVYKRQTRQLSLGERMKCEFIAATLHNPEIVFMDEPTVGVDLPSRMAIAEYVLAMRKESGTTFVITTHVVDDISEVDRIILLDHGRKVFDGSQERMKRAFRRSVILEIYLSPRTNPLVYAKYGKMLTAHNDYIKLQVSPKVVRERWFTRMLADKAVVDYRLTEPGLALMLSSMYKRIDREGERK